MVLMFINSVEFFIAAFVVAMVIVGVLMKPSEKGEVRTYFSRGEMRPSTSDETVVEVTVDERGHLTVVRRGVYLDTPDCELNYAILVIGKDVKITNDGPIRALPKCMVRRSMWSFGWTVCRVPAIICLSNRPGRASGQPAMCALARL